MKDKSNLRVLLESMPLDLDKIVKIKSSKTFFYLDELPSGGFRVCYSEKFEEEINA